MKCNDYLKNFFEKEQVNTGHQFNFDLLKTLALISMIFCHPVYRMGMHIPTYQTDFWYFFADTILGDYIAVAHAFMFAMGVGFIYSKNSDSKSLFIRGIKTYISAYILNFFRYGIYTLLDAISTGDFNNGLLFSILGQDILQFAGLAMMLTALFKKLKLNSIHILLISIVMSAAGSLLYGKAIDNQIIDSVLGSFYYVNESYSCFVLFNWYFIVAAGMLFGTILIRCNNTEKLYKSLLPASIVIMILYIASNVIFGDFWLSSGKNYYAISVIDAIGLLSIDIVLLSVFHFVAAKLTPDRMKFSHFMSSKVNQIYKVHWYIIGFMDCILCFMMEIVFPYWSLYFMGAGVLILTCGIVYLISKVTASKV